MLKCHCFLNTLMRSSRIKLRELINIVWTDAVLINLVYGYWSGRNFYGEAVAIDLCSASCTEWLYNHPAMVTHLHNQNWIDPI